MNAQRILWPQLLAMAVGTAGCSRAWDIDPVLLDDPLGASVKHTLVAQLYDPASAEAPAPDPVRRLDPYKANNTLMTYRLTGRQLENIQTFNVSNSSVFSGGGGGQ